MARAWHLKSRPSGMPTSDNFELKDVALPPVGDRRWKPPAALPAWTGVRDATRFKRDAFPGTVHQRLDA